VSSRNPLGKLAGIRDGGRQEGKACALRCQDDALLPHHASLLIPQVVNLVVHNQRRLSPYDTISHFPPGTRQTILKG
jgi:hypothetical protein